VRALAIAGVNVRRMLRDRSNVFFVFVFPMLLILVLGVSFGRGFEPRIGVVAADPGALGRDLVRTLEEMPDVDVARYDSVDDLRTSVERGQLEAGVVVPEGYDGAIRAGRDAEVRYLARQGELGLQLSRYEGPTGIVGVLLDACRRSGIPSVSLWAAVPHYVSLAPSPRAARALCERLSSVLGVDIDIGELAEAETAYVEQVSEAVSGDADTAAYVEELEHRADSLDWLEESGGLPSGEALAAEIARFLKEREGDGGKETPGPG